ncbi:MAG: ATP-binding protein, partial [Chlorobi bacterium]|nr:ATP-binding protein [Chlorobiota bacterium]
MKDVLKSLEKINYWHADPGLDLGFIRNDYLNKLINILDNKLVKVIVGQRRAGKSYIIRQLINYLITEKSVNPKNIFYLNKELYEFEKIKTAADLDRLFQLYKQTIKPEKKIYVIVDEVQNIEEWEKIIISLAQHPAEDYEVFITGSNSCLLSGELATLLSGRYLVFEVFPFSYPEYLSYFQTGNNKDTFVHYLESTGLPESFNLTSDESKRHYFQSLKDTILLKDIMYRHKIRDYVLLEDLFLFLVHNTGNLVSVPAIIKYYKSRNRKTDYYTVSSFISYMQDAFLIRECPKYSIKTKEHLSGEKKLYVNDLGFRNYLDDQLKSDIAAMLENFVFMHLLRKGFDVKVGYQKNYEVDFVAIKGDVKIYIQVAYLLMSEETRQREFRALETINDNFPKMVVSMDDITISHPKGIMHQQIWDLPKIL